MSAAVGAQIKDFQEPVRTRSGTAFLKIDPLLFLAAVGIVGCSLYTVGTATHGDIPGNPNYYLYRQGAYAGGGLLLAALVSRFDYSRLREWKYGIYGLVIGSNLLVLAAGTATRGSKRWFNLPFFKFQPSELGKVLLVVALSGFMVERLRHLGDKETTSRILLAAILPAMLVISQPDLGSGMVYLAIAVAVLFVAGTKWTHFLVLGVIAAASVSFVLIGAPAAGDQVLKPYQTDRLTAFLHPTSNPRKQGYQLKQAMTGIG